MTLKKLVITIAKYGGAVGLLTFLIWKGWREHPESFVALAQQQKNWGLIGLSLVASLGAVLGTFFRWYLLVRAAGIDFRLRDAVRLGFLAYLFNFISLGVVGGDLLKIVYLAHRHPERKGAAVSSVLLDRAIGLYALLLVAAVGSLFLDFSQLAAAAGDPVQAQRAGGLSVFCTVNWVLVAAGGLAGLWLLLPWSGDDVESPANAPKWLRLYYRFSSAVHRYRGKTGMLLAMSAGSIGIHILNVLSMHLMAMGLPGQNATLSQQFLIGPIAMLAGTLPLPGGLGAMEAGYDFLHHLLTGQPGLVVALGYRAVTLVVAVIGLVYYLAGRAEVSQLIHEAEAESAEDEAGDKSNGGKTPPR